MSDTNVTIAAGAMITTTTSHGLQQGDWITIPLPFYMTRWQRFKRWLGFDVQPPVGTYTVTGVASSNSFEVESDK